jgi:F420-dependent oxidoreductase-like protein
VHVGAKYQIPLPDGLGTGLGKPLRLIVPPLRDEIPIYVAALGPKNVELTAEVADGWLPLHYWPERIDVWAPSIEAGRARRSPDRGPLQIVAGGSLAITDDFQELRDRGRRMLAFYFGGMGARSKNFYNDLLCRYGYEEAAHDIQEAWLSGRHREAMALVPTELLDATSLVGPAAWVQERVEAHRAAGVTVLNVEPVGKNRLADVELVKSWLS